MAYLNHIQTAEAPYEYPQNLMADWLLDGIEPVARRKYKWLLTHAGIETRRCVLPDFIPDYGIKELYKTSGSPGIKERMQLFDRKSEELIGSFKEKFFDQIAKSHAEVTHLITVSCTGISAPGLDFKMQQFLSLSPNVFRFSINFMGCYAAFHALKLAKIICDSESKAKVLIVDIELCSLHFQTGHSEDEILANGLFADGAAMALVSNEKRGLQLKSFFQRTAENTADQMAWSLSGHQFEMRLSTYVPGVLSLNISSFLSDNFKEEINDYAIHPGGKKILEECGKSLAIAPEYLRESEMVLGKYGNMSSVTILYVLKEKMKKPKTGNIFAASFGPGLTMEGGILSYS